MWCSWIRLGFFKVAVLLKLASLYLRHHSIQVSLHDNHARLEDRSVDKDVSGDRCRAYATCASCTNARYPSMFVDYSDPQLLAAADHGFEHTLRTSHGGVGWPIRRPTCEWCPVDKICYSDSEVKNDGVCASTASNMSSSIPHEYDCPLGPIPYPPNPPSLLPDWMGAMYKAAPDALENLTLVDWSLPGTHDSLTYDLSNTVSDDGIDDFQRLADILHALSGNELLPGELEEFFRLQAKTQQLTLTQQLDNGIRFIDFRIMMEYDSEEWYSIHFMQSRQPAVSYWRELRAWLDVHPQEIVVLWLSRHGSTGATGQDQYPGVTLEQKHQLWNIYQSIFDGILMDTTRCDLYTTPVPELLRQQCRVVTFTSDYVEFTGSSPFAMDAARIQNVYSGGVFDEVNDMKSHNAYFQCGTANNKAVNAQKGFTLLSMNTASPSWQVVNAAKRRFLHWILGEHAFALRTLFHSCASKTNIPGLTRWCPETLMDIVQLGSYYNHIAIESAFTRILTDTRVAFPNAFYLDGLDYDGTFRTGTQLLDGMERSQSEQKASRYAYVDTVLAYNARKVCRRGGRVSRETVACVDLLQLIDDRRAKHPFRKWDEPEYGRRISWPHLSSDGDSVLTAT